MSRALTNLSPDLRRLIDDGYELEIRAGHLLIHGVPYVKSDRSIGLGTLVSTLTLAGDITAKPDTHVATFDGACPCDANGTQLKHIIASQREQLSPDISIQHTFSSKPTAGFHDYYEKITHYVALISSHAEFIDPRVTARKYAVIEDADNDSPFVYIDSASSKAGIALVTSKLTGEKVAIIGLGGTGSYVLDYIAKTPVARIDLYDEDIFLQHNAFRSPGAPSVEELRARPTKVSYLRDRYAKIHRGIVIHEKMVDSSNVSDLADADIVFICIDKGDPKAMIIAVLEEHAIPFIDVGMGLHLVNGYLHGVLRVTTSTKEQRRHVREKARIPLHDSPDGVYATNIQIAELNALNAALAVIKWKKLRGVYGDLDNEFYSAYTIDGNHLLNEDHVDD